MTGRACRWKSREQAGLKIFRFYKKSGHTVSAFFFYTDSISGQGKHHRQEAPRHAPAALSSSATLRCWPPVQGMPGRCFAVFSPRQRRRRTPPSGRQEGERGRRRCRKTEARYYLCPLMLPEAVHSAVAAWPRSPPPTYRKNIQEKETHDGTHKILPKLRHAAYLP